MDQDLLTEALNKLDQLLSEKSLCIEIVICGAYALQLHGFTRNLHTQDIDSIEQIHSEEVLEAIHQIGVSLGLGPQWLNDQASTTSIPEGAFKRAKSVGSWRSIKASVVDRADLIKMKASAFSIRREETNKDWEDLKLLKPTEGEIEAAIEFLKLTNAPPLGTGQKSKDDFEETLNDLKTLL